MRDCLEGDHELVEVWYINRSDLHVDWTNDFERYDKSELRVQLLQLNHT